ncbi:MAG: intradiol ring-cleavage dioxygenase [Nitrospirota bacterium]
MAFDDFGHAGRVSRRTVLIAAGTGVAAVAAGLYLMPRAVNGARSTPLDYPFPDAPADLGLQLDPTPACADGRDERTIAQTEGPYYTPRTPERASLIEPGVTGIPLVVVGRVVTTACRPIPGAVLDFWQADGQGDYDNDGYRLRGHQFADQHGQFRLETIKPGAYGGLMFRRTPHIHVKIQGRNTPLLTTQLYFPNEPLNAQDGIFDERLIMDVQPNGDRLEARFDFVVQSSRG